jgi:hypothetical protein
VWFEFASGPRGTPATRHCYQPRASATATAAAADAAIYRNIIRQSDCHVFVDEQSFAKLGAVFDRKYCVKSTEKLLPHCLNTVILWQVYTHTQTHTQNIGGIAIRFQLISRVY